MTEQELTKQVWCRCWWYSKRFGFERLFVMSYKANRKNGCSRLDAIIRAASLFDIPVHVENSAVKSK